MFCDKCGKQIEDSATFCTNCGNPVTIDTDNREILMENDNKSKRMPTSGGMGKYLGIVVIAGIILISILCLMNMPVTVNLNNYVTVTTEGYDSLGKADYQFDYDSFYEDYKDKIKMQTQNGKKTVVQDWIGDTYYAVEMLREYFEGSLSQYSGLSNGDTITFTWNCEDDAIKELFNCNLQYKDIEVEVSGLKEIETFDPFEYAEIEIKGTLPKVTVSVENNSSNEAMQNISFSPVINPTLRNGEKITVQASVSIYGGEEAFIEKYGMLPEPMEKQYTVNGYPEYVFTKEQLTETHIESLEELTYKELQSQGWSKEESLENVEYLGMYICSQKEPKYGDYEDYGSIFVICKVNVNCSLETSAGLVDYPVEYYYYVKFDDLYLETDGSGNCNFYNRPFNKYEVDTGYYKKHGTEYSFYYWGYETLEDLYEDIDDYYNSEDYNIEKSMN